MTTFSISNTNDIIDSRDIIERLRELIEPANEDEFEERELLACLDRDGRDTFNKDEWEFGVTLVRDDYFEDYAKEFAEDCGWVDRRHQWGMGWPYNCIDWEQAAQELQMDYVSIEFGGVEYWGRA